MGVTRTYVIPVCPWCGAGPLVFDPNGLDRDEGMEERVKCECGQVVLRSKARRLEVRAA